MISAVMYLVFVAKPRKQINKHLKMYYLAVYHDDQKNHGQENWCSRTSHLKQRKALEATVEHCLG